MKAWIEITTPGPKEPVTGMRHRLLEPVDGDYVTVITPSPLGGNLEFAIMLNEDPAQRYVITLESAMQTLIGAMLDKKYRNKRRNHGKEKGSTHNTVRKLGGH